MQDTQFQLLGLPAPPHYLVQLLCGWTGNSPLCGQMAAVLMDAERWNEI